jgi:long-chain acyl-CoA synthetase
MKYGSFPEALICKAREHPDKVLIIEEGRSFTYKQHLAAALSFAGYLREAGVKRGDRVVLCTQQTIACLNAYMALYMIGATVVPLDCKTPLARIKKIHNITKAKFIIAAEPAADDFVTLDLSLALKIDERYKDDIPSEAMPDYPKPDDILSILYTTGTTTGQSKGVVLTVDSQMAVAENICGRIYEADDILSIPLLLSHSYGIRRYQATLLAGCTLVLFNKWFVPNHIFDVIQNNNVTAVAANISLFSLLINCAEQKFGEIGRQLRKIELGSSNVSEQLKEKLIDLFPETKLFSTYGATEAGGTCFIEFHTTKHKKYCIGKPINPQDMYIGDAYGIPVEPGSGQIGRICITGRHVMKEYCHEPELTASVLDNGRLIMTDLGYVDSEGFYYFVGRADDVIVSGPNKIPPHEIEETALSMPDIEDCACMPVEDDMLGSVPKLFVVMRKGAEFSYKQIRDHLAARVENLMLPRYIEPIEEIPRTLNGKIIRARLKK